MQSRRLKLILFLFNFNNSFSDPCLAANSDEDDATDPAGRKQKTNAKHPLDNTKLLSTLIQQINILHDTNSKICRNLNDTKGKCRPNECHFNYLSYPINSITLLRTHTHTDTRTDEEEEMRRRKFAFSRVIVIYRCLSTILNK